MDTSGDIHDFITQFHNLSGDLIGERKCNFYKLIKDPALFSTEEQLNDAIKGLKPRTYFESLLKVDLLIYFKRTAELTEILKEGNEVFISKIMKQPWYFQEAFNNLDAHSLTNEFLPCMSYAMRMKLLKRISFCWDEAKMDALFDALCERYGLHVAVPIFHTCSRPKIEAILNDNEISLRPNQVKNLFDRDPSLFKLYVEHANKLEKREYANDRYDETKVLEHVALKNPTLLLELEKEDKVRLSSMGRRTSKRIVDLVKEDIPKDIDRYTRLLNKSVIVRRLGNEFRAIYFNLFPKKIESVNMRDHCNDLLRLYPKNRRWELFAKTFSELFPNKTIDEVLSNTRETFLKLNPGREIIRKWANLKYNEDKKHGDNFLKYFEPSKAIPLIKEKINVTSDIYNRIAAVMLLIETCGENKDLKALEEVLKYICIRHRNEESHFRTRLYDTISSSFKLETLNENHWKYINEQIKIDRVKREISFWSVCTLLRKHLEFLFKNSKDHNAAIIDHINDVIENKSQFDLNIHNPPIEQQIYIAICKLFPEAVKTDNEQFQSYYKNLITTVIDFSISQPDHCINLTQFPGLLTFIKVRLNKTKEFQEDNAFIDSVLNYNITFPKIAISMEHSTLLQLLTLSTEETKTLFKSPVKMFTKKERSDLENEVLKLYFEKLFNICPRKEIVLWFLRNEPRTVAPYFDKVVENCLDYTGLFDIRQLKLYSHFDYDRKVCEFYKAKLIDEECDEKKSVIKNLIILLPTAEFMKVVDHLRPEKDKLDLEDEEMQKMYKLQCEVARILHKVQEPCKMLPLVMKFCVGDYLQSALPSLYGVFYKSAEKLLNPYVDELSKRGAVSVKKHALFLGCEVLDKNTVASLFKTTEQTNVSSQKHQFSAILKYFLKNPSHELLAQVIESMSSIDKNDTETLERLKDIKVPRKYKSLYIESCWGFFEDLEKTDVKVKDYLDGLLRSIDVDVIKSLSHKFTMDVISRYLPLQEKECLKGIEEFTIKVLEHREMERSNNFEIVFKILLEMKKKEVRSFFNIFIENPKYKDRACVNMFEQYWNKHFTMTDTFEEHVALKLLNVHLDCTGNAKLYAENIVACLGELVSKFGLHVFNIFKDKLSDFINYLDDNEKYLIFHNILVHKLTPNTCILVLQEMDPVSDESLECFEVFQTIIRLLETVQDTIVQAYFKNYLIDNDLEQKY